MAEIKSTLELVMEKTRGITLSQKDREEQKNKEVKLKVEGLLQKYQNRELGKKHLEEEVTTLKKNYGEPAQALILYEFIGCINLEEDYNVLGDFLEEFWGVDLSPIKFLLKNYHETIQTLNQETISRLKKVLDKEHCVYGSAVLPNVEGDKTWQAAVKEIKDRFYRQLSREKERLKKISLAAQH